MTPGKEAMLFADLTYLIKSVDDIKRARNDHTRRFNGMLDRLANHRPKTETHLPMAMDPTEIEALIKAGIPDAVIRIEDLRGDGDHYAAHVESESFRGKTRVQQHQAVYQALKGRMGDQLHALALQTIVPKTEA